MTNEVRGMYVGLKRLRGDCDFPVISARAARGSRNTSGRFMLQRPKFRQLLACRLRRRILQGINIQYLGNCTPTPPLTQQ